MCPNGDCSDSYNGGIGPSTLPDCGSCGNCQDCIEPEVVHVKRKPFFSKCEYVIDTLKEFILKNTGNPVNCTLQFAAPSINNNTVILNVANFTGAVEFSKDGVFFKDSAVFDGLACGTQQFFARQKNNPNCIISTTVDITYNCQCIPNWQNTENPPLTDCIGNVVHYRQSDGCGKTEWRPSQPAIPCGCISNWVPTTQPATTRCREGFVETRITDGCGNYDWRREVTTCVDPNQCLTPVFSPTMNILQATCNSQGQILDNASAVLSGISQADKWAIWPGISYSGANYANATPFTGPTLAITNLKGFSYDNSYVLRLFNGSDQCYIDKPFTVIGTTCQPECQLPGYTFAIEQPSCNGNVSNANGVLRLENYNRATHWQLCEGSVFTCTPNFNAANKITGTGIIYVAKNISFSAGQPYRYFTLRVYNGSAGCFSDATVKFDNPCFGTAPTCLPPTLFSASGIQPTCNGSTPNNNAAISLMAIGNATKYGYSQGTTYNGPLYGSAISFVGQDLTISGLPGSANGVNYVVRLFNGSDQCVTDVPVSVPGINCSAPCVQPTSNNPVGTPASCSGSNINNNASISITGLQNATKYGYSQGSTYNGPAFASATSVVGGVISIPNLAGSNSATIYTVRIFNGSASCYVDKQVTIAGTTCGGNCTPPSFNLAATQPTSCNGEASGNNGKVTLSGLLNGTAYQVCINQNTFNCTPNYEGATPISGSAPVDVITNIDFTSSETTKRFWVRVYNNSADCYTDNYVDIANPCKSCCSMSINSAVLNNN